jgi:hypothetical protein
MGKHWFSGARGLAALVGAGRSRLLGLGAVAGVLVATAAGTAGAATGGIWQVVPSANPQARQVTDSLFVSLSMTSSTDGWAAGQLMDKQALDQPLLEHWDGSQWTRVGAPEPSGKQAVLAGVDELSPSDAWAVGTSSAGVAGESNIDQAPLIEHFDGDRWSIVKGARIPAGATGTLSAIGGSGPDDLWAVGFVAAATVRVLFEHFDGTTWTRASFPTQERACDSGGVDCFLDPRAVTATSADDVWVVGTILEPNPTGNFIAHWSGTAWSVVHPPCLQGQKVVARCSGATVDLNELSGITALSPSDAWASGSESNVNNQNFRIPYVLHWDGTIWSLVETPNPNANGEGSMLNGITALNPNDIWAVGQTQRLNGSIRTLTQQFNGTTWTTVPSPSPGGATRIPDDSLTGVVSPGPGLVFAVGARDIPGQCCLRTLALKTTSG